MRPLCSPLPRPTPALLVPCLALATLAAGCAARWSDSQTGAGPVAVQAEPGPRMINILNGCRPVVPPGGPDHTFIYPEATNDGVHVRFVMNPGAHFHVHSTATNAGKEFQNNTNQVRVDTVTIKLDANNNNAVTMFYPLNMKQVLNSGGNANWNGDEIVLLSMGPVYRKGNNDALLLTFRSERPPTGSRQELGVTELEMIGARRRN